MFQGVPIPYDKPPEEIERDLGRSVSQAAAACRALAANESPEALAVLQRALGAKDWSVRRLAVEALGLHVNGREARALVRRLLADPSNQVIRTACRVLAGWGDDECHEGVRGLLAGREPATRQGAVEALKRLWREPDFEAVLQLMQHDPAEEVRREAAWTLRANASSGNWRALFQAWRSHPLPRHRVWACEGSTRHSTRAQRCLNDPVPMPTTTHP
jgi:HEAT repeat protein